VKLLQTHAAHISMPDVTNSWVGCPLCVNQPGQLSLSSVWGWLAAWLSG